MFHEFSYSEFTEFSYRELTKFSYSDYRSSSYDEYKVSLFNDITKTITSTISRTLTATFLNAVTELASIITSNEIIVRSTMIKTLITKVVSTKTIIETHTHFAIIMITVTTSILCTCDENELLTIDKMFRRLRLQNLL